MTTMKKIFVLFHLIASLAAITFGQNSRRDSLKKLLQPGLRDTSQVKILLHLGSTYYFTKPDSCLMFTEQALSLSRSLGYREGEISSLNNAGEALRFIGNYPRALQMQLEALALNRQYKDLDGEATSLGFIGFTYVEFREFRQGLFYLLAARELNSQNANKLKETFDLTNIGNAYDMLGKPDSALYYQKMSMQKYQGLTHGPLKSLILTRTGNAYVGLGKSDSALVFFQRALNNARAVNDEVNNTKIQRKIAEWYESTDQRDSSLYYAKKAIINGQRSAQRLEILETSNLLVRLFRKNAQLDSAFYYEDIAKAMTDSLYGPQKFREIQLLMLAEQEYQQKIIQEQQLFRDRIKYGALISALAVFLLLAIVLLRSNRHKQRANFLLTEQKHKIELTLSQLRSAQNQLIQSEKMASLGELTAGIAHEIQNPLNFVNNFSEVNKELLEELNIEIEKGNYEEVKIIAADIIVNEEKISLHGKRADAIVKGMLQHSRTTTHTKEPTDINALADEYLRLAYHGLRAKDKSFNANLRTEYDEALSAGEAGIGKVNIIPQDIGRVLLNVFSNAFYAVSEKRKSLQERYEPTVTLTTRKSGDTVEIIVADNGNGIPDAIVNKIFQPFFTTKPTGQGTGLGLSLSYDIIKSHGGEINVNNTIGEGIEFKITLPLNS
jgi:signal transduction histidine kinase